MAKSNRGKCKKCELNIDKDSVKIGTKEMGPRGEYIKWYHIDCYKEDNIIDESIVEEFCKKNKIVTKKKEIKKKEEMKHKKGDKIGIETNKDIYYGSIKYVNKNKLILGTPYYWYPKDKSRIDNKEYLE